MHQIKINIIHNHKLYEHKLNDTTTIGRVPVVGKKPDIPINSKAFSTLGGKFFLDNNEWCFKNTQDEYRCYINKITLGFNCYVKLSYNDVVAFVPRNSSFYEDIIVLIVCADNGSEDEWSVFPYNSNIAYALGSNYFYMNGNDLCISSRSNQILVNQKIIDSDVEAHILDYIVIDNKSYLIFNDDVFVKSSNNTIKQTTQKENAGVLSVDIRSRKAGFKELLNSIKFDIKPGEMVLIMGGSGAGKTTLVNAIKGDEKAQDATIIYDNYNVYDKNQYQIIQNKIGYVPQKDTMPKGDTVYRTIEDAAKMSVIRDIKNSSMLREHVNKALETFSLQNEKNKLVSKLSGGETKRLSTAKAYVKQPSLFFLDEPDSGLDENSKNQLLSILSKISHEENKIVIVISHNSLEYGPKYEKDPNYKSFYDKVIVLAKDSNNTGRLAYFGSPHDACVFFEVGSLKEIINRIESHEKHGEGLADYFVNKFETSR